VSIFIALLSEPACGRRSDVCIRAPLSVAETAGAGLLYRGVYLLCRRSQLHLYASILFFVCPACGGSRHLPIRHQLNRCVLWTFVAVTLMINDRGVIRSVLTLLVNGEFWSCIHVLTATKAWRSGGSDSVLKRKAGRHYTPHCSPTTTYPLCRCMLFCCCRSWTVGRWCFDGALFCTAHLHYALATMTWWRDSVERCGSNDVTVTVVV
jgi:hypothetical protein